MAKPADTARIDAIIALLAANGMTLPEALGGEPVPQDAPEAPEPADEG